MPVTPESLRGLVVRCGDPEPAVASEHGCFGRWFRRAIHARVPLEVLDVRTDPIDFGRLDDADFVVISGSPHAVFEDHPWLGSLDDFVREAVTLRRMPVLGVCFGHQMIARALGGRVIRNPRGREMGTIEVVLNPEGALDPLFEGLPRSFRAHASHRDTVALCPPGARLLAHSALDGCQAFKVERAYGVQFHPEVTAEVMRAYVRARAAILRSEGIDPEALHGGVLAEVEGARVMDNFIRAAARSEGL